MCRLWRDIAKEITTRRKKEYLRRLSEDSDTLTKRIKVYDAPRRIFPSMHVTSHGVYVWGGILGFDLGRHSADMNFFSFDTCMWSLIQCHGDKPRSVLFCDVESNPNHTALDMHMLGLLLAESCLCSLAASFFPMALKDCMNLTSTRITGEIFEQCVSVVFS